MPRCAAEGCGRMGSHTFPKDPQLRKVWEKATNREYFKASQHSRLCTGHFKDSDYIKVCVTTGLSPSHRYLKKTAVPTIFAARETADKTASRQQLSRHLRKGVVPSVFPWTKKTSVSSGPALSEKTTSTLKKRVEKKTMVPSQSEGKQQEHATEKTKLLRDRSVRLRNRKAYLANRRCSVPHCNIKPSNEISLHQCPNNPAVRSEWAEALTVSNQFVKNMVVCSLHFSKKEFIQSKTEGKRVLKQSAVPSRNLHLKRPLIVKNKSVPSKKPVPHQSPERPKTMTETVDGASKLVQEEDIHECRACLKKLKDTKNLCNVFQPWAPPWDGMEASIAEDLAKLANVEISITDRHSKVICAPCYQKLLDSATFASGVRSNDLILRQRFTADLDIEKVWPKPIQVDKNINGSVFINPMDVEIKQEVLSDDEYTINGTDNTYLDNEIANLDIKIEPEEMVEVPPMNITINGTISLDPLNSENKELTNGTEEYLNQHLELAVKQEPLSEEEVEQVPDLSLDCLLCTKSFNSVTGLKAHVIAEHSYKTVKRKSDGSISPEKKRSNKHQCIICRRSFLTSTDLMVHETCHNKHACYGCSDKFDTFELLTRHRKRCKATLAKTLQKPKTLEDVKRPPLEDKVESFEIEIERNKDHVKNAVSKIKEVECEIKEGESEINEAGIELIHVESEFKENSDLEAECEFKVAKAETKGEIKLKTVSEINEDAEMEDVIIKQEEVEREEEEKHEDDDSNMKLHLEIHSRENETEATLDDIDMQLEALHNDDCT